MSVSISVHLFNSIECIKHKQTLMIRCVKRARGLMVIRAGNRHSV